MKRTAPNSIYNSNISCIQNKMCSDTWGYFHLTICPVLGDAKGTYKPGRIGQLPSKNENVKDILVPQGQDENYLGRWIDGSHIKSPSSLPELLPKRSPLQYKISTHIFKCRMSISRMADKQLSSLFISIITAHTTNKLKIPQGWWNLYQI